MKSKKHWEQCKSLPSYKAANQVAFQLKECAKVHGYDPRGIHVLSKEDSYRRGSVADAQVTWSEGPDDWAKSVELYQITGVHIERHDGMSISFYDIILPSGMEGDDE